jgi:kynurenine formamidase
MTDTMSRLDFDNLFERCKNWGRWGDDDERGAINNIDRASIVDATRLVTVGRSISLGRALDTVSGPENPRPALHFMTELGGADSTGVGGNKDFIGVDFHAKVSHLDAIPHIAYRGQLYGGRLSAAEVGTSGSMFAAVDVLAGGIVTRGVLLDAAHVMGEPWIEPPRALGADELAEVARHLNLELRRGDAVLVRTGAPARRRERGQSAPAGQSVGLHPLGVSWLLEHDVALLGSDGNSDALPSVVDGISSPVHVLAIVAAGMCLLDSLDLEELSAACIEAGSFEFLLIVAPLIIPGGTGSPVNPIAVV